MQILVVDVGGNNVKLLATGQTVKRKFPSGPQLTPEQMLAGIKKLTSDWNFDHVSIGFPGPVKRNRPAREPVNLGSGWVAFDYDDAFGCPVRMINDAAMQALGSYQGNDMLFLGLGTGLGTTLIYDGYILPMEIAHLPYRKNKSFEDYVGKQGLKRLGKKKWKRHVFCVIDKLSAAFLPDYVMLGGGNSKKLTDSELPELVRRGDNTNAFTGGYLLWESDQIKNIA